MTHEKEFSRQQLPQNSHRRDSRGTKVVAIFDLQRQNKFAMREYFQAPVAQRMAVPPFRDLLPVAEQAARGISDIPSCTTGTRRSPHGVSAGGGGGHLSYRSSSFVSTDGKAIEDMQAALDLRNKLSCWGVTDGKGRPQGVSVSTKPNPSSSHSAVPSLEALGLTADKSELLGESVIFDFEIEDCHKTSVSTGKMDSAGLPREIKSAFVMTMDSAFSSFDINLRADVNAILSRMASCTASTDDDLEALAEGLRSCGYNAGIQVSSGSYKPATMNFNLRHRFICCIPSADSFDSSPRIVDPSFKDQFDIACPSPAYCGLMELVPKVFVGTAICLQAVVETLSDQMTESFRVNAMPTPPWRRIHALYSKWLPLRVNSMYGR